MAVLPSDRILRQTTRELTRESEAQRKIDEEEDALKQEKKQAEEKVRPNFILLMVICRKYRDSRKFNSLKRPKKPN
jgi:hypothetical protein